MGAVTFAGFVIFSLGALGWMDLRRNWAWTLRLKDAEPGASPNGGPATSLGNSEATEEPASVR